MINTPLIYIVIFTLTFLTTALIETKIIPIFSKKAKQPIYEGGPDWHMKKSGTPTMGGIAFLIPITLSGLLLCIPLYEMGNEHSAISLFLATLFALINAGIGLLDDITKLKHKENKGLSAKEKFFLQTAAVIFFMFARWAFIGINTTVRLWAISLDLGWLYYPLEAFILLGIINCANLTDGIDGLASVVAFAASVSLFYVSFSLASESAVLASSVLGGTVAFMMFNIHPAKIFMGDTGSLFLGSAVAAATLMLGNPLLLLGIGGVYVIEGVSVVLQVAVYKASGKRVFKMAPLHHHLEKSGWSENKICITAILLTFILSLLAMYLFPIL